MKTGCGSRRLAGATLPGMNVPTRRLAALLLTCLAGCRGAVAPLAPQDDGPQQVHTAWLTAEVELPDEAASHVSALVAELHGRVVRVESTGDARATGAVMTLRVPSTNLETALSRLEALAVRVTEKRVKAEDVSAQHVDLTAQRTNLAAARDRLLALLDRARTASEALEVSRALEDVQGRLEQTDGRLALLAHDVAMSQVVVTLVPRGTSGFAEWRPLEVARSAAVAMGMLLRAAANLGIVLAVFSPLWAPVVLVIRRRRAART